VGFALHDDPLDGATTLQHLRPMRAIVIARPGGPEVLELRELPSPEPSRGEVRVRIRATAVNRADLLQRIGAYPAPPDAPADIPGLEFAGEIAAVGAGVSGWSVGDRVFGLAGGGTYAEEIVVHARTIAKIPEGLSFVDAAAIPEAFVTAWDAIVDQAGLRAGETLLVSAVGSGVGTAAIQIARAIGARSVGTARTEAKLERARALGMDHGVVAKNGLFAEEVERVAGLVDVVCELVGGAYLAEDLKCVRACGRIVLVGLLAGRSAELDLGVVLRKRVSIRGTVLRSRPLEEKILAAQSFERHVVPLVATGALRPVIERVLPLSSAGEAHAQLASNEGFGKIVLET
jgi:putative PIG3 family NAD(P)H quinone oxidoreductase